MDKPRVSKIFDIPPYYYFESGNDYSGSKNLNQFNYKVEYGKENSILVRVNNGEQLDIIKK